MSINDYRYPPYRIKNIAVVLYGIGTGLLFITGLVETFAFDRLWGIALLAVPTAIALIAKAASEP